MPTRIRLQRHGKKNQPFYHIVVADGRAPRDGRFIEKLGTYNPLTNPAEIILNEDSAVEWIKKGAQPSTTCRRILSYKGVLLKRHLQIGVEKGAITQEQADVKFNEWKQAKDAKIAKKVNDLESDAKTKAKSRLDAEINVNNNRAAAIDAKRRAAAEAAAQANAEANAEEAPAEEAPATEENTEA